MRFALILSLLIAIAAVVFAIYNPDPVQLQLAGYALTAPLAVVIIVALLAGVVAGLLASVPSIIRRGTENRRLRKHIDELESGTAARPARTAEPLPRRPRESTPEREAAANAAETERLAAETERMAAEAQRRSAELERQQRSTRD